MCSQAVAVDSARIIVGPDRAKRTAENGLYEARPQARELSALRSYAAVRIAGRPRVSRGMGIGTTWPEARFAA